MSEQGTAKFCPVGVNGPVLDDAPSILAHVYQCLKDKGYDPVVQLTGYLISGDPTYITSHNRARSLICRLERDEIMEELVSAYLKGLDNE